MAEADVQKVIDGLGGRVNLQPRKASPVQPKALRSADIARMGAARISVGPQLYNAVVATLTAAANEVFAV
ncbi:hypothetical protein MYCTH_2306062 [Thermothelomyces thermophilus ATCC 42464]|uniref:Uncharacterized protein n=1 Tax=Thermothelomyces thermophilus (strain ATCC 42464 / BCRC 31852 / DSM 1799) TaxID=573729 RepID=G2QGP5_THET4|nr:uncharacterized protein MYCTH_2306062 [Thermothelomyces thermophilus ATCC 42464]AEO58607.1 hypothetical protein MYCTH_2306062 [Thermothelomyces thermophilus ATCC 42464]